jgi:hypothetical protein
MYAPQKGFVSHLPPRMAYVVHMMISKPGKYRLKRFDERSEGNATALALGSALRRAI